MSAGCGAGLILPFSSKPEHKHVHKTSHRTPNAQRATPLRVCSCSDLDENSNTTTSSTLLRLSPHLDRRPTLHFAISLIQSGSCFAQSSSSSAIPLLPDRYTSTANPSTLTTRRRQSGQHVRKLSWHAVALTILTVFPTSLLALLPIPTRPGYPIIRTRTGCTSTWLGSTQLLL